MYIVIVGAGRVGFTLARWLISAEHEISVIESNPSKCAILEEILGNVSIMGNATDANTMAKAGTNRADVFIATTENDDVNLATCQLAKNLFRVLKTISVVTTRDHMKLFTSLGIDLAIDTTEFVLDRIQESLATHGLVHLMPVGDGILTSIKIPADTQKGKRPIKNIPMPNGSFISLVIAKDGHASTPTDNTSIGAGDEVIVVTTTQDEEKLRNALIERS